MRPVKIWRDAFGKNRPGDDILVTPSQKLLYVLRCSDGSLRRPVVKLAEARSFDTGAAFFARTMSNDVTYVSLMFESTAYLMCGKLILLGYLSDQKQTLVP